MDDHENARLLPYPRMDIDYLRWESRGKGVTYYKQMDSDDLARGVQLLGNDCTHYINKHEDVSPETIETFYRYFATLLNAKYESRHLNDGKR